VQEPVQKDGEKSEEQNGKKSEKSKEQKPMNGVEVIEKHPSPQSRPLIRPSDLRRAPRNPPIHLRRHNHRRNPLPRQSHPAQPGAQSAGLPPRNLNRAYLREGTAYPSAPLPAPDLCFQAGKHYRVQQHYYNSASTTGE
jgi:hypothetical protein